MCTTHFQGRLYLYCLFSPLEIIGETRSLDIVSGQDSDEFSSAIFRGHLRTSVSKATEERIHEEEEEGVNVVKNERTTLTPSRTNSADDGLEDSNIV